MQTLFYISLGVTALGFVLAVVIFFLYDIPMIYAIRSGKQEEKTVAKLNRRSAKIGNFGGKRPGKGQVPSSVRMELPNVQPQKKPEQTAGHTGETSQEIRKKIKKLRVEQNSDEINRPPILQETEALGVDSLSRLAVQDAAPKGDTMPLRVEAPAAPPEPPAEQNVGMTVDLSEQAASQIPEEPSLPEGFLFQVVEDILLCDTEERI